MCIEWQLLSNLTISGYQWSDLIGKYTNETLKPQPLKSWIHQLILKFIKSKLNSILYHNKKYTTKKIIMMILTTKIIRHHHTLLRACHISQHWYTQAQRDLFLCCSRQWSWMQRMDNLTMRHGIQDCHSQEPHQSRPPPSLGHVSCPSHSVCEGQHSS